MSKTKVAHVVVEMVVTVADQEHLPLEQLCEGLPLDAHTLRRRLGGLEWELFVELFERIEAKVGRERLLAVSATPPAISPIGSGLLRRFVSPRALLNFVCRVAGPTMYPMYALRFEERERDDGALTATFAIRLEEGLRASRTVFELHAAAMIGLPAFIGQPPFVARANTTDRGCTIDFELRAPTGERPS